MILIRADANEQIGAGHVMRCLAVARALRARGEEVRFVTADRRADRLLARYGLDAICLDLDRPDAAAETEQLSRLIRRLSPAALLTDSYAVAPPYFQALSPLVKTAYFDDLNAAVWDVDLLINYNIFSAAFDYTGYGGTRTKLLLTPRCAPLREEFQNRPPHAIRETAEDVFVSTGGADPENVAERLLDRLCPVLPGLTFHFVIGPLRPGIEALKKKAGGNAVLHINETNMAALMRRCDIAVAAAGATLYELCACGVPTVAYTLADNQRPAAEQFAQQRLMLTAGDCRNKENFLHTLRKMLSQLAENRAERQRLSEAMQQTVDGRGADRIAEELLGLARAPRR